MNAIQLKLYSNTSDFKSKCYKMIQPPSSKWLLFPFAMCCTAFELVLAPQDKYIERKQLYFESPAFPKTCLNHPQLQYISPDK